MENNTANVVSTKWYQKPFGIIIFLVFIFPVGLYLMWRYSDWSMKTKSIITVIVLVLSFVEFQTGKVQPTQPASVSTSPAQSTPPSPSPTSTASSTPTVSKEQAQKELDDTIALAKKAQLVTSYEFSNSASVVYVSSVWYTQTVEFKKDFLAKIATLKEIVTGYKHFEVRDAYSNEKVGEVTAFTGSLEVYK